MSDIEKKLDQIIETLNYLKPYVEWGGNYSLAQLRLLKMSKLEPKNVIEFYYQGTIPIRFYIPRADIDHIQTYYLMNEIFWDQHTLEALQPLLGDKHILDIGANVGNHSVFWGAVNKAASVNAFEPIPETFNFLQKNIELNNLGKTVKIHRCALGAKNGTGDPTSRPDNRMEAAVKARIDSLGAITVRTLDSFKFRKVDFVKIYVEGHTLDALQGAVETIGRHLPVLYIELFAHEATKCKEFLSEIGYDPLGSVEKDNYIFYSRSRASEGARFKSIVNGEWIY